MVSDQRYQRDALSALLKWTLTVGPVAALLNLLGYIPDPDWTTLVGSGGVLLLALIAWWCLRRVGQEALQLAAQVYLVSGMMLMALMVFIGGRYELLVGAMGLSIFVGMATFFEPPQIALRWGGVSVLLYEAALLARSLVPSLALGFGVGVAALYIVPPVILMFFSLFGRIMNEHLTKALRESEIMRIDLERSYAEVEQRVEQRTRDLVEERNRLDMALRELALARD